MQFGQKKEFLGVLGQERANSLKNLSLWTKRAANFAQKPFLGNFPPLLCGNLGILCGNLPCCAGNCAGICLFVREFFEKPCIWLIFCVFGENFGLFCDFQAIFRVFEGTSTIFRVLR